MINTQLASQIANTQKNDLKVDNSASKDKTNLKDNPKEALAQALKQNLGLSKDASSEEILAKFVQNETGTKLKELVNKLLDQINAQKNPDSPVLKQGKNLNLAPNFANELKTLSTELAKSDTFTQVLDRLNQILKPASEIKNNNLAPLFKNSGVFLEAKLKDALNEELLPKSFHSLLSTIKGLNSEKLSVQIAQLANTNLSPKDTLKELKNIINSSKIENKQILNQSSFKALLNLSSKLENFKNYISKNPSHAQEKITPIANKILKELNSIKNDFFKALNKPENLMIKDPNILKQTATAFEKLENTLKNILGNQASKIQDKENILENLLSNKENMKEEKLNHNTKNQDEEKHIKASKEETLTDDTKTDIKQDLKNKENSHAKETDIKEDENLDSDIKTHEEDTQDTKNDIQNNETENKPDNDIKNFTPNQEKIKDEKQEKSKENIKENPKFYETKTENKTSINTNTNTSNPNTNNTQNLNNSQNIQSNNNQTMQNIFKNQEFIKQNIIKNLAFNVENLDLEQVQDLSKNLSNLSRRLNESLKELEPYTQNAKLNQAELKNLEHKLNLSTKDLAQIKPKTEQDIAESLHHDVKSTLLQISNLAKNEGNEAIYNQANRLLAQIEINQLMSLANDSINTYLPFSWDDLNDSKIMFRRGKKDKFFAQIKLEFAKLGDLEILISLNNEKYIDINIMAENIEFRKTIYENAHELKRNINKAGLLSANFFVGDIIRSKFDTRNMKNLDLEMGMDKKV
ncbi:flagellar hook-length control protein FliK [Campylobacter jejuni]|uniref:flagellar hook-length control protein FliK n=1 Tax=Campylobacter jejuni TaxID=197 RepID=UPI001BFF154E|nr:flagellar hook-length control protein FliK [Campylobacter jejuni]HEE6718257.1 flagellar hook-length control protein FliK [Campylobacter jejuni subsp. jejuni]ECL6184639.1 flagellar hook-length control protein FliK [Campylobacter jejuni]EDO9813817.1 flagellar hook-length control protein FliK [Campylobacter jejuni]EEP3759665.1 flagellar hook-length control protein FliK [Campylobacter jejuni]ELL1898509.1 flagellar hook-length control protein FliK [Campylobacter jejuni]